MVCINVDIDDKPLLRVVSIDREKDYLVFNFKERAYIPRLSRWKPHKVTFWLYVSDGDDKKLAEFITKGARKRKNSLYVKLDNRYMVKSYEM